MSPLHLISRGSEAERKADVVFVHGLGGNVFETWNAGLKGAESWPHWLAYDFPDVGVWSLEYAASPTKWARLFGQSRDAGHGMALPDRATQILDLLVQRGFGKRPILFICHSLGGLVVKQILRSSADDLQG